jgi:uncharacterized protein
MKSSITFEVEGFKLCGNLHKAENEKSALLLLAGGANIPHDEGYYPELQGFLSEYGITSLAFDFSGVGKSEGILNQTNLNTRIADAKAALDFLKLNSTSQNLFILGISMGAPIALEIAGSEVKGIILVVPAAYSHEARDKNFGPDFSAVIRRPESWAGSPDFENLKNYDGKVLFAYATVDEVIPEGIYRTYEEIVKAKNETVFPFKTISHKFMREPDEVSSRARETLKTKIVEWLTAN